MKAVVAAFNQEKALVGAFSVITNLRMELFQALIDIDTLYIAGIQVFQNEDKSCPERHGGANQTSLYIDSSEPSPGGGGMWKPDNTIRNCHHIPTLDII